MGSKKTDKEVIRKKEYKKSKKYLKDSYEKVQQKEKEK